MFATLPILYRVGIIFAGVAFIFGGWLLYYVEANRFDAYKAEVVAAGLAQEVKTKQTISQQQLITRKAEEQYAKDLASIRNTYKRLRYQSSINLPTVSDTTGSPDATVTHYLSVAPELAEQCAQTTGQLDSLQSWIKDQQQVNK